MKELNLEEILKNNPELKEKKVSSIELLDAIVHLSLFLGAFYVLDHSVPIKKPLNYFKTRAEF